VSFLNVSFVVALSAVLIPIILHFFYKRQINIVHFSSIRFLKEIEAKQRIKTNVLEYILLMLRVLAIVFIVLAFMNPVTTSLSFLADPIDKHSFLIIDRSAMLSVQQDGESLLFKRNQEVNAFLKARSSEEHLYFVDPFFKRVFPVTKKNVHSKLNRFGPLNRTTFSIDDVLETLSSFAEKNQITSYGVHAFTTQKIDSEAINVIRIRPEKELQNEGVRSAKVEGVALIPNSPLFLRATFQRMSSQHERFVDVLINNKTVFSTVLESDTMRIPLGSFSEGEYLGKVVLTTHDDYAPDNQYFFNFKISAKKRIAVFTDEEGSYLEAYFKQFPDSAVQVTQAKAKEVTRYNFSEFETVLFEGFNTNQFFYEKIQQFNQTGTFVYIPTEKLTVQNWNRSSFRNYWKISGISRNRFIHRIYKGRAHFSHIEPEQSSSFENRWNIMIEKPYTALMATENNPFLVQAETKPFFMFLAPLNQSTFKTHELFAPSLYSLIHFSEQDIRFSLNPHQLVTQQATPSTLIASSGTHTAQFVKKVDRNRTRVYETSDELPPGNYSVKLSEKNSTISVNPVPISVNEDIDQDITYKNQMASNNKGSLWRLCVLLALLCYLTELWLGRNIKK